VIRVMMAALLALGVVQGALPAQATNPCEPKPQCCPTDPQCYLPEPPPEPEGHGHPHGQAGHGGKGGHGGRSPYGSGTSAYGLDCGFTSSNDPTGIVANPGTQIGEMDGGPIAVADLPNVDGTTSPPTVTFDTTGNPASATITCALQVGGTGTYAEADAVSASASGTAAVYLPPTVISYQATGTDAVWSCTTWTLTDANGDTETLYLDDTTGEFSTDPATAVCALAIGF
jgi:hypothetical protein